MSLLTPPARAIDPRGQRFGAAVSAILLAVAFLLNLPWLAALVGLNLAVSAAFGTRLFLPGRAWPVIRQRSGSAGLSPSTSIRPASPRRWAPRSSVSRPSPSSWAHRSWAGC